MQLNSYLQAKKKLVEIVRKRLFNVDSGGANMYIVQQGGSYLV